MYIEKLEKKENKIGGGGVLFAFITFNKIKYRDFIYN